MATSQLIKKELKNKKSFREGRFFIEESLCLTIYERGIKNQEGACLPIGKVFWYNKIIKNYPKIIFRYYKIYN